MTDQTTRQERYAEYIRRCEAVAAAFDACEQAHRDAYATDDERAAAIIEKLDQLKAALEAKYAAEALTR